MTQACTTNSKFRAQVASGTLGVVEMLDKDGDASGRIITPPKGLANVVEQLGHRSTEAPVRLSAENRHVKGASGSLLYNLTKASDA